MSFFPRFLAWLLTALFALTTFLPMLDSPQWWIRGLAFPRIHYLVALLPLIAIIWWLLPRMQRAAAAAILLGCGIYQAVMIAPYTPLNAKELNFVPSGGPDQSITAMSVNVLMENEDHAAVAKRIKEHDPDLLFLMETDKRWLKALDPVLKEFGHVIRHPKDNHYGLAFATNLKVRQAQIEYLTVSDTPSIFAELETPTGTPFRFVGLHPRPPVVGVDTQTRDDQLYFAARFARRTETPVLVMGDFNTVVWSRVAHEFKRVGEYLDPRIGRGPLPSFNAKSWLMRFPIDQLYVTPDVALVDFARGEPVGSDHFPIIAKVRIDPELAQAHNNPPHPLSSDAMVEIEKRTARHQKRLDEVDRGLPSSSASNE
jgi:endonuclease/exonuclease/phosphatase (EEP) superfamily protein YafD